MGPLPFHRAAPDGTPSRLVAPRAIPRNWQVKRERSLGFREREPSAPQATQASYFKSSGIPSPPASRNESILAFTSRAFWMLDRGLYCRHHSSFEVLGKLGLPLDYENAPMAWICLSELFGLPIHLKWLCLHHMLVVGLVFYRPLRYRDEDLSPDTKLSVGRWSSCHKILGVCVAFQGPVIPRVSS